MDTASKSAKPRGRPFQPGHPGGPGRPKGFRAAILAKCGNNLESLVNFAWDVLTGEATTESERVSPTGQVIELVTKPSITERLAAARFLAEYAEGKPAAKIEVSGQVDHAHFDYSRYTVDELKQLRTLLIKGQPARGELPEPGAKGAAEIVDAEFTTSDGLFSRESSPQDPALDAVIDAGVSIEGLTDTADDPADDPFGGDE